MQLIKKLILLSLLIILAIPGGAQNTANFVRGVVSDDLGPLAGANVVFLNDQERVLLGVTTDINGEYYLKIPQVNYKLTISFSFVGCKPKKIPFKGQKELNVTLESDVQKLNEVQITAEKRNAMGVSYKNLTASVERIELDAPELATGSAGDALQGRLANVDMVATSGAPGSGMSINIRGISTLSASSQPLIVLDNIPQEVVFSDDFDFATANEEDLGQLVNLAPADIESIEVLKDAAATAIYGSKGANGVLLITTKQGRPGKMSFRVTERIDTNFEPKGLQLLNGNEYVSLMQDALWNNGLETRFQAIAGMLTHNQINFNPKYEYWREYNQNTDWLSEISRTAMSSETDFSMEGGGERTVYRFSANYLTDYGTTIGTSYDRLSTRLNLTYKFSNRFRIQSGISFVNGNRHSHFSGDARGVAMRKMPNMSPYIMEEDGVTPTNAYFRPVDGTFQSYYNPIAMALDSYNNNTNRDMSLNLNLNYNVVPGLLNYLGTVGFNVNTSQYNAFLPESASTTANRLDANYNRTRSGQNDGTALYIKNQFTFNKTITGGHNFILALVNELRDNSNSNISSSVSGVASQNSAFPGLGDYIREMGSGYGNYRSVNFAGNFNYTYKNRYSAAASYSFGANSGMYKANRWAGFPSVSASWRIEQEPFMKNVYWINLLKLSTGWGQNGRPPGGNPSLGRFAPEANYGTEGSVGPSTMQLTKLKMEIVDKYNAALVTEVWNNRFEFVFDYYRHVTKNLLQNNVKVPGHTGFNTVAYYNSGKMKNEGLEFRVSFKNFIKHKDYRMSVSMNISKNINTILELPDNINYLDYPDKIENKRYASSLTEGHPLGSFYGFRYLGVYKDKDAVYVRNDQGGLVYDVSGRPVTMWHEDRPVTPGDAIYEDINKDGVINKYDIVCIGNAMPKFTGGAQITFGYKAFSVRAAFHGRFNFDIVNSTRMNLESMRNGDNQSIAVLNRWRHEGDEAQIPKALWGRGYNILGSDRFVEDGSFVRLQQVTLSYKLPNSILQRSRLNRVEVFVTGKDLFTWTKYSGQDPEVGVSGGFSKMSYDNASTPRARRLTGGVTIEF